LGDLRISYFTYDKTIVGIGTVGLAA